ncbi:hypothetical protein PsorP6_012640 [Peronosclerospora sorghi]|uniref:Uncharacterized protein n=1 Tax=Peronosclerospora sorghi TaxID=230839 RepID=A0ACC0WH19_9STRA|nr:hypothetical protein PsorP6_012640 [Peronosclerospora sorghi]
MGKYYFHLEEEEEDQLMILESIEDNQYFWVRINHQTRYNFLPFGQYKPEHDLEALYHYYLVSY